MAREIQLRLSMGVRRNNLLTAPHTFNFSADMAGQAGPTPGLVVLAPGGTEVDLSLLTTPGWTAFANLEPDGGSRIEFGVWDPETSKFYPVTELEPGEGEVISLSRALFWEYGTGTGTVGSPTNRLYGYSKGAASAKGYVGSYER